jgi:hypothetical protein
MSASILHKPQETPLLTVSPGAKKIFKAMYREQSGASAVLDDSVSRLAVSDLISKMSFYYEKIRNAVHYREEHLLRKDAIARIIKRQLLIESPIKLNGTDVNETARHLLVELIRAGYLPNNTLPETKIGEVAGIIEKYLLLRRLATSEAASSVNFFGAAASGAEFSGRIDLTNWLVGLAAAEIEELISPDEVSTTLVSVMYALLEKRLELPPSMSAYERELPIQLYLSIHRHLMKYDDEMLSLILMRYFHGEWKSADLETIKRISKNITALHKLIREELAHPLLSPLSRVVGGYTVYFNILKEVVSEDPVIVYDEFFDDPKAFPRRIKQACARRYASAKTKLWRSAWRSIIYILLTKSIFAVLLEIPAANLFGEIINPAILAINISMPAVLLFFAVAVTRLPGEDNTKRIIAGIEEIVFNEKQKTEPIVLRKAIGRNKVMNFIFGLIYTITFFISFGAIVWLLEAVNFSWVSTVIFLFFLAFVSFFIIRIRRGAKEWIVVESRDTIFRFILDFFSTPIVATGKWLSTKFSRINVFVFVLDFIIEAPFKIFVEIAEEWTKYVRERKEQI